jgi:hypothetical protein
MLDIYFSVVTWNCESLCILHVEEIGIDSEDATQHLLKYVIHHTGRC